VKDHLTDCQENSIIMRKGEKNLSDTKNSIEKITITGHLIKEIISIISLVIENSNQEGLIMNTNLLENLNREGLITKINPILNSNQKH